MALNRRQPRRLALALIFTLLSALATLAQQPAPDCIVHVTLLQVNDVYQFMPVDQNTRGGLARVSTLRKRIMEKQPNTLLLLAGDTLGPSVESIKLKGQQMIDSWNAIGLDFAVFGNHEFDFGPDVLRTRISESKFKWLGANVFDSKTGKIFADTPPFVIREFQGVKIGIFGLVLPETKVSSSPGPDVEFQDPCATAGRIVPEMRKAGAQIIIALTHLAMKQDKELARCVGIDVIIGGHEHTLLESLSGRTPIFKMTADAREMGRIDLNINARTGALENMDWAVIPVTNEIKDDPQFALVTTKYKDQLASYDVRVGRTDVELDARSAANRTRETNIGDFIADAFRQTFGADAALINGGSIRADTIYRPGDLSLHDVLSILPFGGGVTKIEVTGATLRAALEHGVSQSGPGAEPGRFPQVSGIRYSYDTSAPAGSRIGKVMVNGQLLDEKRTYTLAVPTYVANGGDEYAMFKGARQLIQADAQQKDSEILRRAIANVKSIAPQTDGRIERLDQPKDEQSQPCDNSKVK